MRASQFGMLLVGLGLTATVSIPMAPASAAPLPVAPVSGPAVRGPGVPLAETAAPAEGQKTYIVGFRPRFAAAQRTQFLKNAGATGVSFQPNLGTAVVNLTPAQSKALRKSPEVKYVEADGPISASTTESSPPWGLDRLDGSNSALDNSFTYYATGAGVDVYVIDTGIAYTNTEFTGRVKPGAYGVSDGLGTWDCNGHGTHVSGTIGGTRYGVAKKVSLIPVRVLDCNGSGLKSMNIQAMDWVVARHVYGTPAVVNMSLGGGFSQAENDAVQRLIADGITVAVAAGNEGADACYYSPSSAPNALTVGATDSDDFASSFSNQGSCVDLFAPGRDILSAYGGGSGSQYLSGTSMASPHVAGVAALILSRHRLWTPATVSNMVLSMAVPNVVEGDVGEYGSPNRLLSIAPRVTGVSPNTGVTTGKQRVAIVGSALYDVTRVTFGSKTGTGLSTSSGVTVRTPKHSGTQTVAVQVYSAYSRSGTATRFTYQKAPSISSISTTLASSNGGQRVTINGSRFQNVTKVLFGSAAGTDLRVASATQLSVTTPKNSGRQYVRVVAASGTSAKSKRFRISYGNAPTVTTISPTSGWIEGGAVITVTGLGFTAATAVKIGGVTVSWTRASDTKLVLTAPAHAAGRVPVQVSNKYGASLAVAGSMFTYQAHPLPSIASVSPTSGPTSGGNVIKITGSNFTAITSVSVGGVAVPFTVPASNVLSVTVPAHTAGTVDVRVTGRYGTSPVVAADHYTYVAPAPPPAPAPTPSVRVSAGASINTSSCTSSRCHYVVVTTANFSGNVTCRVTNSDYGAFGVSWVQGPNETRQSPNYFGAYWITVTCDGVSGTNSNWPS